MCTTRARGVAASTSLMGSVRSMPPYAISPNDTAPACPRRDAPTGAPPVVFDYRRPPAGGARSVDRNAREGRRVVDSGADAGARRHRRRLALDRDRRPEAGLGRVKKLTINN